MSLQPQLMKPPPQPPQPPSLLSHPQLSLPHLPSSATATTLPPPQPQLQLPPPQLPRQAERHDRDPRVQLDILMSQLQQQDSRWRGRAEEVERRERELHEREAKLEHGEAVLKVRLPVMLLLGL